MVDLKLCNRTLFHIGIDTVQLEGKYFTPLVSAGDYVKKGQPLLQFDLEAIKQAGYDPTVICVVTNKENFIIKPIEQTENMSKSEGVLSISPFVS
ncbi:PTS sugar transporter subunit IIA [Enterococcus gallinarum]